MEHILMFPLSGCTGIQFFFILAWTPSGPSISSPVMQIGLSAVSPNLPNILSGDTGDSHLQRDKPVTRPWKEGY